MELDDELECLKDLPRRSLDKPAAPQKTDGKPFFHTGNHGQKPQSILLLMSIEYLYLGIITRNPNPLIDKFYVRINELSVKEPANSVR